jgi:hypothetical protein
MLNALSLFCRQSQVVDSIHSLPATGTYLSQEEVIKNTTNTGFPFTIIRSSGYPHFSGLATDWQLYFVRIRWARNDIY